MFDNLYKNIGGKLKTLATISFFVETLSSLSFGISMGIDEPIYLLITLFGPFIALVSSWVLYAFGELVEDVHAIRNKEGTTEEVLARRIAEETARLEAKERAEWAIAMATTPVYKEKKQEMSPIELSDDDFIDVVCPNCKSQLSFFNDEANGICPECGTEFKINKQIM